jgi:hypothetical protein
MPVSLISISGNRLSTSVSARLTVRGPSRNGMPTRSSQVTPVAPASDASAAQLHDDSLGVLDEVAPAGVRVIRLPARALPAPRLGASGEPGGTT